MEDDWDLHAVVRGCFTTTITSSSITSPPLLAEESTSNFNSCSSPFGASVQSSQFFSVSDPFDSRYAIEELEALYEPFFPESQRQPLPQPLISSTISPISSLIASKVQTTQQKQQPKQSLPGPVTTPRSKRRKNQLKKVCQVSADGLCADVWAWRKYGQKPIKGSPYPRGYYRCSSSKGCLARKQVERDRSDPGMFIVTYTGEHNHPAPTHRNSLAGSTRQKPVTSPTVTTSDLNNTQPAQPACSSSSVEDGVVHRGTTTESKEEEKEDEVDEFGIPDLVVEDDFFVGFEELDSRTTGDYFTDLYSSNFGLPWIVNNATTAAGGR